MFSGTTMGIRDMVIVLIDDSSVYESCKILPSGMSRISKPLSALCALDVIYVQISNCWRNT